MGRWLRFDVPNLTRMRSAGSGHNVWRRLNNDAVYQLERRLTEAFGVDVTLTHDHDPNTWQLLQRLFLALDRARRLLGYTLAGMSEPDAYKCIEALENWLADERNGVDSVDRTVILSFVRGLLHAVAIQGFRTAKEGRLVLDHLVEVTVTDDDDEPTVWSSDDFDVFISYKHRPYSVRAEALRHALAARGLRVWLDRRELPISPGVMLRDILLKRKLMHALSVSRHTVFFQTVGEMHADENFRGEQVAHNWQSFEQRYARDLLYVNPGGDLIVGDRLPTAVVPAQSMLEFLVPRCRESSAPARRRGFGPIAGADPDLDQAANELRAHLKSSFGDAVAPSPLAEIALLAPGSAETGQAGAAYGDDVLIQLLRYDAAAALELHRAGLDLYWMFAVAAKLNDQRWQRPHDRLIGDVFGSERSELYERIRARGTLSTADILRGILEFAAGNCFPRDKLRLALRAGRGNVAKGDLERAVDQFRNRALELLQREERELGVHGWLFMRTPDGPSPLPVTDCGRMQMDAPPPGRLLVRQSSRLFAPDGVERFRAALASGRTDDIERALEGHKEIARTLTGAMTITLAQDFSRIGNLGQLWFVGAEEDAPVAGEVTPGALLTALEGLRLRPKRVGMPLNWPWGDRGWQPCVLVAPETRSTAFESNPFDVIADVLQPIDAYLAVRTLEYDDF